MELMLNTPRFSLTTRVNNKILNQFAIGIMETLHTIGSIIDESMLSSTLAFIDYI